MSGVVLFIILPFHFSFSYLWSSDILKFCVSFFQVVCRHVYACMRVNIYSERELCVYSVYTHSYTQRHTYVACVHKKPVQHSTKNQPLQDLVRNREWVIIYNSIWRFLLSGSVICHTCLTSAICIHSVLIPQSHRCAAGHESIVPSPRAADCPGTAAQAPMPLLPLPESQAALLAVTSKRGIQMCYFAAVDTSVLTGTVGCLSVGHSLSPLFLPLRAVSGSKWVTSSRCLLWSIVKCGTSQKSHFLYWWNEMRYLLALKINEEGMLRKMFSLMWSTQEKSSWMLYFLFLLRSAW